MKKTATALMSRPSAPLYQPHGPCVLPRRMAGQVQSITRAEIDNFWRRKELEEEEHRLTHEKEAARIKVKSLKQEEYMLFEQRIKWNLDDNFEKTMEGEITNNSEEDARNIQIRIGIKDWWRKSSCEYLNEPAVTSTDGSSASKDTTIYTPQNIHFRCCSQALYQINVTALGICLSAATKNNVNHRIHSAYAYEQKFESSVMSDCLTDNKFDEKVLLNQA